jgi:hypothetical protein
MRDAHRRICGVHMLSALAAGAVSIDADIVRLDDDVDAVINLRRNEDAGERCVTALGLIKRRDADQAVYTDFALQKSECIVAVHRESRRLQPRFFTRLIVVENGFEALPLSPSQVHAQKHVGPILRFGSTRSGMDGDDGVAGVVFAGEQRLGFELVDQLPQRGDFPLQVAVDIFAFFRKIKIGRNISAAASQISVGGEHMFEALFLAHHLLGALRVRPQVRVGGLLVDFG